MADTLHDYLFHQGTDTRSYEYFGCHKTEAGYVFRVWAQTAQAVSVVGDFNGWDVDAHPCTLIANGIWEATVPAAKEGDNYKYRILARSGEELYKADPYATRQQTEGETASIVYAFEQYDWDDAEYIDYRTHTDIFTRPINIYECHIGSWRTHEDGSFYSYREFADAIVPYLKEMGYTHLEVMGISEHPFDGSWGYQVTGYFAPTSRYGRPEDFCYLVDSLHRAGLGIILDWVPGHFPRDAHGLRTFDGTPQYEYADPLKSEHKDWGTMVFDYAKPEVKSFLISSAYSWIERFHLDGLRVDAVASMLYLDYARTEYRPNKFGGRENLEVVEFFRHLNSMLLREHPNVMMIAEESTAWPLVTKPPEDGGLGFNFKWNMGWMNDILSYVSTDPIYRKYEHNKITFSFMYCFSENFILPISHDEVVHGKYSLLNKMHGPFDQKFDALRGFAAYMIAHPGKKLNFMGNEFAQVIEWNYKQQLDWLLLDYEKHASYKAYVAALNHFYLAHPELYDDDFSWNGTHVVVADDRDQNLIAFERKARNGKLLLCVTNFSPVPRTCYGIGARRGKYRQAFCSADLASPYNNFGTLHTVPRPMHGYDDSVEISVPPFATVFLEYLPDQVPPPAPQTDATQGEQPAARTQAKKPAAKAGSKKGTSKARTPRTKSVKNAKSVK